MARTLINLTSSGSPSAAAFTIALDALLASLTDKVIVGFKPTVTDMAPIGPRAFKASVEYEDGGATILSQFRVKVFEAEDDNYARAQVAAFQATLPSAFFSPTIYAFSDQIRNQNLRSIYFLVYCTDPRASSNWQAGGPGGFVRVNQGGQETVEFNNSSGAAVTINLANANVFDVTLDSGPAAIPITITGAVAGKACSIMLILRQDAVGSRTVSWPAAVKWPGALAPVLTTTIGAVDMISLFTLDGGTTWYGNPGLYDLR